MTKEIMVGVGIVINVGIVFAYYCRNIQKRLLV
jgi:hypothetical protein